MRAIAYLLIAAEAVLLLFRGTIVAHVCENGPHCAPGWWLPAVIVVAVLLMGSGFALVRRDR